MQMRKIERLGITVSALGYGCMRFPMKKTDEGEFVDESISTPSIRYAIDHGVRVFRTEERDGGGARAARRVSRTGISRDEAADLGM